MRPSSAARGDAYRQKNRFAQIYVFPTKAGLIWRHGLAGSGATGSPDWRLSIMMLIERGGNVGYIEVKQLTCSG